MLCLAACTLSWLCGNTASREGIKYKSENQYQIILHNHWPSFASLIALGVYQTQHLSLCPLSPAKLLGSIHTCPLPVPGGDFFQMSISKGIINQNETNCSQNPSQNQQQGAGGSSKLAVHPALPITGHSCIFPCQAEQCKKSRIKPRNDGQGAEGCQPTADADGSHGLGGLFQFSLFSCPSISSHANKPSKLIYTAASCARPSGFTFSSSQHERRINNVTPTSRETQSASQEHVASHSVMGALWGGMKCKEGAGCAGERVHVLRHREMCKRDLFSPKVHIFYKCLDRAKGDRSLQVKSEALCEIK